MKAALLACFFFAPSLAHSAIIYQEIPENEQIFISGQRAFDFDGNGATDLTFFVFSREFQMLTVTAGPIGFVLLELSFGINAAVLGERAIVSDTGPYLTAGPTTLPPLLSSLVLMDPLLDSSILNMRRIGPWAGQSGYLGFSFYNLESESAHYGWLEMEENDGWLRLKRWAYESENNRPLLAGQIPEPSSLMLLMASAGMVWRRRRGLPEK